jgi:FMN phosphatase YigB (HAD superfamily)
VAVTFDLYDTLVVADRPAEPWSAVATTLADRDVAVPDDWEEAYRTSHADTHPLAEQSLVAHTRAALASRGVSVAEHLVYDALLEAFDGEAELVPGARLALRAAADAGPTGVLSNCSLPGLVPATVDRLALPIEFDAIVTSVSCGWRKPHDRAFVTAADALGVDVAELVHVGDDPRADGGGRTAGATVVLTGEVPLSTFPGWVEDRE